MLKKLLVGLGVLGLTCGLLCGGCLIVSQRAGSRQQERFFAAVASGDPAHMEAVLAPSLRSQVDEPMLAAWIDTVNRRLGPYKRLSAADFHTSSHIGSDGTRIETSGTVQFANGTAKSRLRLVNDLVVDFAVTSDKIADDWWIAAATNDLHRQRGEKFLSALLGSDERAAYSLMDPSLQRVTPPDKLQTAADKLVAKAGPVREVEYASHRLDPKAGHPLVIFYKIEAEKEETIAKVDFTFDEFRARIVGFELSVDPAEMKDAEVAPPPQASDQTL